MQKAFTGFSKIIKQISYWKRQTIKTLIDHNSLIYFNRVMCH